MKHRNALSLDQKLEEYQLIDLLGHGGFGLTYLAKDVNLNSLVAIKEYFPSQLAIREGNSVRPKSDSENSTFEWGLQRFLLEAQTLAQFSHINIVRVLRYFKANDTAYMVMPFEEGVTLTSYVKKLGHEITETEIKAILIPLLDGLEAVHNLNYLHRDIKPSNIFIREDGSPVLLDFGAARQALGEQSQNLTALLSPGYAPPEQYSNAVRQGPWTDIYALGAVTYQLIYGKKPMDSVSRLHATRGKESDDVTQATNQANGKYSKGLLLGVDMALNIDVESRPTNISDWRELLFSISSSKISEASQDTTIVSSNNVDDTIAPLNSEDTTAIPSIDADDTIDAPIIRDNIAIPSSSLEPKSIEPMEKKIEKSNIFRIVKNKKYLVASITIIAVLMSFVGTWHLWQGNKLHVSDIPELQVTSFMLSDDHADTLWLRNRIERNLVALFLDAGLDVKSILTSAGNIKNDGYRLGGRIERAGDHFNVEVSLINPSGKLVGLAKIEGDKQLFKEVHRAIPEAIIYGLDIDKKTLKFKKTRMLPTQSLEAFSLYLTAQGYVERKKFEEGKTYLDKAFTQDESFAMAAWSIAQIEAYLGNTAESKIWRDRAKAINPDHPRWPIVSGNNSLPVAKLLESSRDVKDVLIEDGITIKTIHSSAYDITLHSWSFPQKMFKLDLVSQKDQGAKGEYIPDFNKRNKALLLVNGGFFEMDHEYRLSPSGLVVIDGIEFNKATKFGGSGVLLRRGNELDIVQRGDVSSLDTIDMALQSGPILVEKKGKLGIYSNDYNRVNRSAVCLRSDKFVIVIIEGGLSLYEFAKILASPERNGGMGCHVALNLDGGPSTQGVSNIPGNEIDIKGHWRVENALVVKRLP